MQQTNKILQMQLEAYEKKYGANTLPNVAILYDDKPQKHTGVETSTRMTDAPPSQVNYPPF